MSKALYLFLDNNYELSLYTHCDATMIVTFSLLFQSTLMADYTTSMHPKINTATSQEQ